MGFDLAWSDHKLAYFRVGAASFLLPDFYNAEHAAHFMMHLLVGDVDAWWRNIQDNEISANYQVQVGVPEDRAWGLRDFTLVDPTGVRWRIGQNLHPAK